MNTYKVTYADGTHYTTNANGTLEEFTAYLMQFGGIVTSENPVTGEETKRTIASIEQIKKAKGLIISVYRDADGSDCSNNGISARYNRLTLVGAGIPEIFEVSDDAPAVTLITRVIGGEVYKHLQPCDVTGKPLPGWWMFGGNFAKTSDSRFPHSYPLGIHDRQE